MDEDFDPRGEQQPEQQPEVVGPPPVDPMSLPYGQSQEVQSQKLLAGLGQVEADKGAGKIDEPTYRDTVGQIMNQLKPLAERKKAAEAFAQQSATQTALHGIAQQQAVQSQNALHDASLTPHTVAPYTDPETGLTAHFYQPEPGKKEQVDWGKTAKANRDQQGDESERSIDPGQEQMPAPQPGAAAPNGGPFVQTIRNGQYTDRYENGQLVGTDRPAIQANKIQGFSPEETAEIEQHAHIVGSMLSPGPHRDVAVAHARLDAIKQISARKGAAAVATRQQEHDQRVKERAEASKQADLTMKQMSDLEDKERARLTTAIHDHRLHTTDPKDVPEELKGETGQYLTPSEITAKSRAFAEDKVKWLNGRRGGGAQPAAQPGQQQPAAQAPAQPNQPVAAAQSRVYGSPKPATQQPTEPGEPKAGSYVDERSLPTKLFAGGERERVSDVGLEEVRRLGREAEDAFNNPSESEGHATMIPGGDMARRALGRLGVGSTSDVKSALNILKTAHDRGRGLTEPEKAEYQKVVARLPGTLQDRLKLRGPKPAGANERSVLPNG